MKTEVLKAIRKAEEEYQAEIAKAKVERERRIAAATLEADSLVMKARTGTEEFKKQRLEEARREAARKRDGIMRSGEQQASLLREQAGKKLDIAVRLLMKRFEAEVYAQN
jgi:V/A-type H+-transporting ATPase subunit G/H